MNQREFSISAEQVAFYDTNGYLVVDDVVSQEDCDKGLAFFLKLAELTGDRTFKGRMNFDREAQVIYRLFTHPNIVTILRTLRRKPRGGVVGLQTMFLFKKANSAYAGQAWNPHQDNSYVKMPPGTYLTANLPFSDQDPSNGGMYIFPGSHKEGLLPCEEIPSFREKVGTNPGNTVKKEFMEQYMKTKRDLYLKKGSVLILDGNVVHGSYPNTSHDRDRPMLLMVYGDKDVPFPRGGDANRRETILEPDN